MLNPIDQTAILGGAQALVPDWAKQDLQKRISESLLASQATNRQVQQQELQEQALTRQRFGQYQTDVADAWMSGDPAKIGGIIARYPDQAEPIRKAWEMKDNAARTNDLRQMGELYSSMRGGRWDLATSSLERRIQADREAGQDTADDEMILAEIKSDDPTRQRAAMGMIGMSLASIVGPDKFGATLGTISEGNSDFTLGPGAKRYAADGTLLAAAPFAPRPLSVGEGETVYEYNPNTGGGDPASSGGGAAEALRTNPGAIKDGPWARSQPGYAGSSGGFATFASPEQGKAAQTRLLRDNYVAKGFDTPSKIVERYAPRGPENSDASVNNYKQYIANRTGIGVNDKVPPEKLPLLAQAMREFETGQTQRSGGGGPRVIAQGKPKAPPAPSQTRSVGGKVYVKVEGRWYMQGAR